MIVIGIDIGVTGALAAVDSRRTCCVHDLPTVPVEGNRVVKRRIDSRGLLVLLRSVVPAGVDALALIEDVHAGMGPGMAARASLMHSRGVVETVLELARVRVCPVQPAVWKRAHGLLKSDKAASLAKARELSPSLQHALKRQLDHNRAEALLLAWHGLETYA